MLKYVIRNKAEPGTHALPLYAGAKEVVLSTIIIPDLELWQRVVIEAYLEWENPMVDRDIGELDVRLRRNDAAGPVLQWTQESCYQKGSVKLSFEEWESIPGKQVYCLTVQSMDRLAYITGPVYMSSYVYDDKNL